MNMVKKKKKGFTLIELLLALALGAIFTAIAFSFFLPHQQALNNVEKKSQLQMDMQLLMESFSQSAMEAASISDIDAVSSLAFSGTKEIISDIKFKVDETESYNYSIDIKTVNKNIFVESSKGKRQLSSNLSSLKVTPLGATDFLDCHGITIDIKLSSSDGKITYSASNNMYFRNKN